LEKTVDRFVTYASTLKYSDLTPAARTIAADGLVGVLPGRVRRNSYIICYSLKLLYPQINLSGLNSLPLGDWHCNCRCGYLATRYGVVH